MLCFTPPKNSVCHTLCASSPSPHKPAPRSSPLSHPEHSSRVVCCLASSSQQGDPQTSLETPTHARRDLERVYSLNAKSSKARSRPRADEGHPVPPIVHSAAYLRSQQRYEEEQPAVEAAPSSSQQAPSRSPSPSPTTSFSVDGRASSSSPPKPLRSSSSTDNALEWAMRRADQSLDELERNPHPLQKVFFDLSRGPAGEMTSSAMQAAAKLTYTTGREVAKVAAPVGKWALSEGLKTAGGLILGAKAAQAAQQKSESSSQEERKKS